MMAHIELALYKNIRTGDLVRKSITNDPVRVIAIHPRKAGIELVFADGTRITGDKNKLIIRQMVGQK